METKTVGEIAQEQYDDGNMGDDDVSDVSSAIETLDNIKSLFSGHPFHQKLSEMIKSLEEITVIDR